MPSKHPLSTAFLIHWPRVRALLHPTHLRRNLDTIALRAPGKKIIPMVKADGYGHGAVWATNTLLETHAAQIHAFGVATLEEGQELRTQTSCGRIIVFSGATPWSAEKWDFCERYRLEPVFTQFSDWDLFRVHTTQKRRTLPFHLEFNTGMNRMGIAPEEAESLIRQLDHSFYSSATAGLQSVFSHLAVGENPAHKTSRLQQAQYDYIFRLFKNKFSNLPLHLANSAAIWNFKKWQLDQKSDWIRPGIALYGIPPWPEAKPSGLQAAMELQSQIISIRTIPSGQSVGYGSKLTNRSRRPLTIATLAAGYADGLARGAWTSARLSFKGKKIPFAGVISMDLSACICPKGAQAGDWVSYWGPSLNPWKQAAAWDTIPYACMTSVGRRVYREVCNLPENQSKLRSDQEN